MKLWLCETQYLMIENREMDTKALAAVSKLSSLSKMNAVKEAQVTCKAKGIKSCTKNSIGRSFISSEAFNCNLECFVKKESLVFMCAYVGGGGGVGDNWWGIHEDRKICIWLSSI